MEGTDAPVRTPRRGKKQVIFYIFLLFFFLRKEKLEAMSQPAFAFCQCGDKLRLWPSMEGSWTCETCPAANQVLPKRNEGTNRLVCFPCDWNICTDCVGAEVTVTPPKKEDWQIFFENTADKNHDGFLSVDEVLEAFPGDGHDREWAQNLVDLIDSDHDGRVSLEEFRAYYNSEWDPDTHYKNLTINRRKRLLKKQEPVDGWIKKTEWTEVAGQWQQTSYWINKHTGERTHEDPFKFNLPLEMKNKAALKRMESTDGAREGETRRSSNALPYPSQPSTSSSTLPFSPQPSTSSGLPYNPQPQTSSSLLYSPQLNDSYGPPSLPPPSYSWATSAAVAPPPQTSWTPPAPQPMATAPPPSPPPTAPLLPSSSSAGWIDPPPIPMYNLK